MVVMLIVLGAGAVVLLGLALIGRFWAARAVEASPGADEESPLVTDRMTLLPPGHRPPEGLSPLSPSERFLAAEASRGLRELQRYLHDAA